MPQQKNKTETVLNYSDDHFPFQDQKVVDLRIQIAKDVQPDVLVIHEMHDFYEISDFDKDPKREVDLQGELDMVDEYLTKLRKACPKTRIILLDSNHLDRLRRYKWRKARELSSLRCLNVDELLQLKKHNIEFVESFLYKGFLFKHGDKVNAYGGFSAKNEFVKEGVSGQSGHTHRGGQHHHTDRAGQYSWSEVGCACLMDAHYIKGVPDWQHGFGEVIFTDNEYFERFVPIKNYTCYYNGKLYKSN